MSWLDVMSDDEILDAVVDCETDDAFVDQVLLGSIGPEAHDATGPTRGETRDSLEVFKFCAIDVYALVVRRCRGGCGWSARTVAVLELGMAGSTNAETQDCHYQSADSCGTLHCIILRPVPSNSKAPTKSWSIRNQCTALIAPRA